jgi:hypothetical protein
MGKQKLTVTLSNLCMLFHIALYIPPTGSGNPAEGELRPQLLDRFGLSVNVSTLADVQQRTQMVLDRLAYEQVLGNACGGGVGGDAGACEYSCMSGRC